MSLCSRRVLCGIAIAFCALASSASAQNSSHQGTPAESKTGQSGVSTYARDKIETVNLANGNLSLSIPLATVGGRGSAGYTVALSYNSKVWTSQHDVEDVSGLGDLEDVPPEVPPEGSIRNLYTAVYEKLEEFEPGLAKLGGGWTIRVAPGIKALTFGINPSTSTTCSVGSEEPPKCGYKFVLTKMWLTLPDGSQLELRDRATRGTPAIAPLSNGFNQLIDRDRGRVWQSIDGSGVTFVRDSGYTVGQVGGLHYPSGWVFLGDGTRMRMDEGVGSKIIDRNGNFVDVGWGTYTDELGRQTVLTFSENTVTVTVKGYLGVMDRSITIQLGTIGDNLRSDFQLLPRPFTTGDAFRDTQGNYFEHTIQGSHTDLFNHSEGIKHYGSAEGDDVGAKSAVTRLNLLDGRSLRFRYNQYGEVAEVVYPGDGVSQIDYSGGNSGICQLNSQMAVTFNRRVSQRRTLTDGTSVDATWVYGYGGTTTSVAAHQGDATGTQLAVETHFFLRLGLGSEYRTCFGSTGTGNEKWDSAKEFRSETQTGTGTVVTMRNWQQRAPLVWVDDGPNGYLQKHGQDQSPNDPRVTWEETTLENGKVRRVEYAYDDFNNNTSTKEYGFGTTGNPGTLLRETVRTYAGSGQVPTVNGYCYTNLDPLDGSCGSGLAGDVSTIIFQRHLLLNETVRDGSGNQKAYSEFEYDKYGGDTNHAAAVPNPGMIMYDGARFGGFNLLHEPRGNVTKVTRWLGGGTDVVAYSQYDNAGHVVWSKDPNGNVSTVSYTDNFGNGTNPEPGAGLIGPAGPTFAMASVSTNALGHQAKMQYDYSLGAATGVKDPNGVIAKTEYDNLGRPFRAIVALSLPEQSISEMSYPTETANEARVSKQLDATRWLTSKTSFDSFDRPVLASTAEDGLHYNSASYTIFSKTVYDPLGRVKLVTNPYRAVAAATDGWSRSSYDLGGRLTEVATFAGIVANPPPDSGTNSNWTGSVTTVYASEVTTVTDQAGKQRQSVSDAMGRLIQVYEAPNEPSYNYLTSYDYDTLDNLTRVTQGSQIRYFMYDSLNRLQRARNPEQDLNGNLALMDPLTGNSQWSIAYTYDNNSNLTQKTDARGIVSTYVYDVLNRNTTVDYSDTSSTNPDITRIYDTATNGIGRLRESYAGGNESNGAIVEHTKTLSYDALGRPLDQRQRFKTASVWSAEYKAVGTYNLAGAVTLQIYPSGRSVSYAYDNAGRSNSFSGNLGDGTNRTYASGILYSPVGGRTKEQFGTDTPIYNKSFYNSRGQLAEIRVSTSYTGPTDTTWDRGAIINHYSNQSGCWGASCNATDNNGNLRRQEVYIPRPTSGSDNLAQFYEYDSLNRLQSVRENFNGGAVQWQQEYAYDRYGNRTLHQTNTWGTNINKKDFTVNTANNNRLGVPGGQTGTMAYDNAGNLTTDTYSGAGVTRAYDAENRMTSETQGSNYVAGLYTYNAAGQRVRRKVGAVETWQVYGMDGELLAEYAATNAGVTIPQKEYGYRNGQLLVTTTAGTAERVNFAHSSYSYATASSSWSLSFTPNATNNGDRNGLHWGYGPLSGNGWQDATANTYPDWLQIDLNASRTIDEIDIFTIQDNWWDPVAPSESLTFTTQGITSFDVQYWNGAAWVTVTGGSISGNNKVWRKLTFAAITTSKIRVLVNGALADYSRIVEVEAWGTSGGAPFKLEWLVADQLGTPRMVFDKTGALANVKRHDYLPFGEELFAGQGGRTTALGYASDNVRQKFTSKERDIETGLDYFLARYYSSTQGRFTSPDEFTGGPDELYYFVEDAAANPTFYADLRNPQSLNKYQYAFNNPLRYVDPDGHDPDPDPDPCCQDDTARRVATGVAVGAAIGTVVGGVVGAAGGAVGGGAGGTVLVPVPVVGTASGAIVGGASGGTAGAVQGAAAGGVIGGFIGYAYDRIVGPSTLPFIPPVPTTANPPSQQTQPLPPPPPIQAEHTKGKRKSTQPKHEKTRSGDKKPPGFKPRNPPRPQDMQPKPPKAPKAPKRKPNEWEP